MRTPVFTGTCPALVTPFDHNGNINYDAFGKLIDAQIEAGVDAVCVCGTTGEAPTLSDEEKIGILAWLLNYHIPQLKDDIEAIKMVKVENKEG